MDKTITLIAQQVQLATFLTFITVLKFKWTRSNKVLAFFSSISLEFYLMQRIALNSLLFITGTDRETTIIKEWHWNLMVYFVAVLAANLILAFVYKWINKKIYKVLVK